MYAWIDNAGKIYPVDNYEGHIRFAERNLKFLFGRTKDPNSITIAHQFFFKKNWARVRYDGKTLYVENPYMSPTSYQIKELKNIAIENQMDRIVIDWVKDERPKIIWSNDDI